MNESVKCPEKKYLIQISHFLTSREKTSREKELRFTRERRSVENAPSRFSCSLITTLSAREEEERLLAPRNRYYLLSQSLRGTFILMQQSAIISPSPLFCPPCIFSFLIFFSLRNVSWEMQVQRAPDYYLFSLELIKA